MFTAWVNLQPPITPERRETVIVHAAKKYPDNAMAEIFKDGQEIASAPMRSLEDVSVFRFHFGSSKPPFTVEIVHDGQVIDRGTIDQIAKAV